MCKLTYSNKEANPKPIISAIINLDSVTITIKLTIGYFSKVTFNTEIYFHLNHGLRFKCIN